MSTPLRAQDPDESAWPSPSRPALIRVPDDDPQAAAARARAEAEAAVADVMALEEQRARTVAAQVARKRRPRLDVSQLVLVALSLVLLYLVDEHPKWMIAPIPANEAMFQYYRDSWRTAIDLRQQEVLEARMRRQGLVALHAPLVLPHVRVRGGTAGYIRRGDSDAMCVAKTVAFSAWSIQLGGR